MRRTGRGAAVDWLVVGLGNPGREYAKTRHNAGFLVADELASRWHAGRRRERYRSEIAEVTVRLGEPASATRVALMWPQTFMNDAGRAVGPARGAMRLPLERLIVVHDEIDLPFGEVRTRLGGGLAGHNGLRSLRRELGGADFWRVRVGVGRPPSTDPEIVAAYVLARFTEPAAELAAVVERAVGEVEQVIAGEPDPADTARQAHGGTGRRADGGRGAAGTAAGP